jgi:hypothetical protein
VGKDARFEIEAKFILILRLMYKDSLTAQMRATQQIRLGAAFTEWIDSPFQARPPQP